MNSELTVKDTTSMSDRLRVAAEKAGNLKCLAEIAEVPYPTLMRYLKGTEPKRDTLARIVSRLAIDGTWLLTGRGQPENAQSDRSERKENSGNEIKAENTVYLPKFSQHLYTEVMETAEDFETRSELIHRIHKSLYRHAKYPVEKSEYELISEDEREGLVAFDYQDSRGSSAPVRVLVNLYVLKPKQGQRSLVLYEGSPYILKARIDENPRRTVFFDQSEKEPLPDLDFETLARDDSIIGRVVTSTYFE